MLIITNSANIVLFLFYPSLYSVLKRQRRNTESTKLELNWGCCGYMVCILENCHPEILQNVFIEIEIEPIARFIKNTVSDFVLEAVSWCLVFYVGKDNC